MRWKGQQESGNVEDRRGMKPGMMIGGGGGIVMLIIVVIVALMGGDPRALLTNMQQQGQTQTGSAEPINDEASQFVRVVLASTEKVWAAEFRRNGMEYRAPKLIMFSQGTQSGCGFAQSAVGPFYCPADNQVYLDVSFFNELSERFGAKGDFAAAYVIAHEVGHHVQNLLGMTKQVDAQRGRISETEMNELSVRLELQADYLAGVWAHHANSENLLDPGDIEEAIRCAQAIGDDKLQKEAQGYVVPDSFTHGSSAQRAKWFMNGFKSGELKGGDTFSARDL